MTAIVIAHFNRYALLKKTLATIPDKYYTCMFIVDDASDEPLRGENVINIAKEEKYWLSDGTIPYNRGIEKALQIGATNIIIQNAECYWVGDIIEYVEQNLTEENYIAFPCFSLSKDADLDKAMRDNHRAVRYNGDNGWYNHATKRPTYYFFCAAISANNIRKLNGFDERFSHGVAMADEDFVRRVRLLGLNMEIPNHPMVVHQWHYEGFDPYSKVDLYKKNQELCEQLRLCGNIKAQHLITKDYDS